jgi:hypothetical protein
VPPRSGGLPIGRDEKRAAWHAADYLQSLPAPRILPVIRQALACGTQPQEWACRKLGLMPGVTRRQAVIQAREQVGSQPFDQHRKEYEAQRQAKARAPWDRRRQRAENAQEISKALDEFMESAEFKADQAAAQIRHAEQIARRKAQLAAVTPEEIVAVREQRKAYEREQLRKMGLA